jgi:hypothetical protein
MKENASQLFFVITKKSCLALKTVQTKKKKEEDNKHELHIELWIEYVCQIGHHNMLHNSQNNEAQGIIPGSWPSEQLCNSLQPDFTIIFNIRKWFHTRLNASFLAGGKIWYQYKSN